MKRNMLLAVLATAAFLMVSAGSVAEASRWNRGYSGASIHHSQNGFRGNYRGNYGNYRPVYRPVYRTNYTPYRSWNGYRNNNYSPYNYGNRGYIGSNGPGLYFRF